MKPCSKPNVSPLAPRLRRRLSLLAILCLGLTLRLYQLEQKSLWIDEAFSVWMARQPPDQMLEWLVRIDQHPPLYYTALHLWLGLDDGPFAARALSAACSTLTLPVLYCLGRRLFNQRVGLTAALILALSPFHVHLAQEARMYAPLALNAALALYALARLLTDPRATTAPLGRPLADFVRSWRAAGHMPPLRHIETDLAWLGYVIFTTATLLTHNTAIFFPLATNLLVLAVIPKSPVVHVQPQTSKPYVFWRNWLLAQTGVCLLWLPWLPAFLIQSVSVYRQFWLPPPDWHTVLGAITNFLSAFLPYSRLAWGAAGALYVGLIALGLVHLRRRRARLAFLLLIFATPLVGEWLVSLRRPIFYDRTLIWASLPLYLLVGVGLSRLRRWPYRTMALLGLAAFSVLSLHAYYVDFQKEAWDRAAGLVARQAQADDLILFNTAWGQIPFDYYFHRLDAPPVEERGAPVDLFDRGVLEPRMTPEDIAQLRDRVRGHKRVWLIYSHQWYTDPQALIPHTLQEEGCLRHRWEFYQIEVHRYHMDVNCTPSSEP